jgi:uncharacterized protein (DUF1330 family)
MAKGYWIARFDVSDMEQYRRYVAANAGPLAEHGARFLVRGGACDATEGTPRERNVVVEFPSYAAAMACYRSPGYQVAIGLRRHVAVGDFLVIEGYDGPQPEGAPP